MEGEWSNNETRKERLGRSIRLIPVRFLCVTLSSVGLPERFLKDAPTPVAYHTPMFVEPRRRKSDRATDARAHAGDRGCVDIGENFTNGFDQSRRYAGVRQTLLPYRGRRGREAR